MQSTRFPFDMPMHKHNIMYYEAISGIIHEIRQLILTYQHLTHGG
jgi:hypothetical protein